MYCNVSAISWRLFCAPYKFTIYCSFSMILDCGFGGLHLSIYVSVSKSFFLCLIFYPIMFCIAGAEESRLLAAEASTFTVDGLQPDEPLVIGVAVVVGQRTGEVVTLSSRTNSASGSVSGLRIIDVTSQRIRIGWSPSPRATGYKITWRRSDGVQLLALKTHSFYRNKIHQHK